MSDVLVIGNATVDVIQRVERLPIAGETLLSGLPLRCAGGKGFNQALAAARTGAQVRLVAAVGADADAAVFASAVADGDELEALWLVRPDLPTDLSAIWVASDGENMIVSSAACARSLTADEAGAACRMLRAGDVLLMQGNLSHDATHAGAAAARKAGATTILNTAPVDTNMAALLDSFDIVIANAVEARHLTGLDGQAAVEALRKGGQSAAIMTLGAAGAVIADRDGLSVLMAPKVTALDASGAGDVMVGTLAGLVARNWPLRRAAAASVAAASLSVTRAGTTPSFPSRAELREIFRPWLSDA